MRCLWLILVLLPLASGCQKSDTETLSRLGRKLADRGQVSLGDLRARIGFDLNIKPPAASEEGLAERVRMRLRTDRDLADVPIEIKIHGGVEVELLGKVKEPHHKRRALELAETTRGAELVTDHIEVEAMLLPPVNPPDTPMPPAPMSPDPPMSPETMPPRPMEEKTPEDG